MDVETTVGDEMSDGWQQEHSLETKSRGGMQAHLPMYSQKLPPPSLTQPSYQSDVSNREWMTPRRKHDAIPVRHEPAVSSSRDHQSHCICSLLGQQPEDICAVSSGCGTAKAPCRSQNQLQTTTQAIKGRNERQGRLVERSGFLSSRRCWC